jgi:hypothetical protein
MTDVEFLPALENCAKYKERSHNTYQNIHLPELNVRCGLGLNISEPSDLAENDPFAPKPDLGNTNPIAVVYLGNSMLERLKTTGYETQLARLSTSWNAGCGGDKNENVIYRMTSGTYRALAQPSSAPNIKLWILASGTNNLRPKAPFRPLDVESWQLLLESCLRIAPDSKVLACDMFYRKDIPDEIVDQSNEKLKEVVRGINEELVKRGMEERVMWVEVRNSIGKHMLVDNVHLNEEGYQVWDGILWPYVQDIVISKRREEGKGEEDSSYESS